MHKIEAKRLWLDTVGLYEEYQKDNKRIYENLYKTYFYETDGYNVLSKSFHIYNCIWDFCVYIDRYTKPVKTYFLSVLDMETYAMMLRQDPMIRKFTKLCFYIEEKIKPYNTIDNDLKTLNNKRNGTKK